MARFRSGNNALGLREQAACVEALELRDIDRFHQLVLEQLRYDHACSVIPQSARMDVGGSEVVPQREHRQQRRIAGFVSEVVAEDSARELRAGVGLGRDVARLSAFLERVAHERERDAAEIRSAAEAADDQVGVFACHFHLFFGLETDDRLVQRDVAQHRAERVLAVRRAHRQLDRLRDRRAERALMVRMLGEYFASGFGRHRRRGGHLRAESLHDRAPVGFLLVTDLDHVDGQFQPERLGGVRQGGSPLAGAGLGRDVRDALPLAVIGLSEGRVQLVRADGTDALVLEIDVRRGAERLFQSVGPDQRRAAVVFVLLADFVGDIDPRVGLVHLLIGQRLGENGIEIRGFQRLFRCGIQRRHRLVGHVGHDVVPPGRNL